MTTCALCAIHVNSYHCGLTTIFLDITMLACGPWHKHSIPAISSNGNALECVVSDMWRGNADTHACVCVQDARIPSQDPAYTLATLDDLCTVCNTCQFIPLWVNYNISRYHTCALEANSANIAFRRIITDIWSWKQGNHGCGWDQEGRIPKQ